MFNMFLVNRLSRALRLSPPSMTPQQPDETLQPKLHPKASSAGHGDQKPRLLLLGEKGSGKTSVKNVVFQKLPPSETLFLSATKAIEKISISTFTDFEVWDFPGDLDILDPGFDIEDAIGELGTLVWVIDGQSDYHDALCRLHAFIIAIRPKYPFLNIDVLIHKADSMSDDYQMEVQQEIADRTHEELLDNDLDDSHIFYHLTSVYEHSILEAFSKIIQRCIPLLPTIESLLDLLCASTGIHKAFLFDSSSKVYIATDTSPVDQENFEICSDYINFVLDMSETYVDYFEKYGPKDTTPPDLKAPNKADQVPQTSCIVKLDNRMVLYLREMNPHLALTCLVREECMKKQSIVDFNIDVFQKSLEEAFNAEAEAR